jgi:hypothetical protein
MKIIAKWAFDARNIFSRMFMNYAIRKARKNFVTDDTNKNKMSLDDFEKEL